MTLDFKANSLNNDNRLQGKTRNGDKPTHFFVQPSAFGEKDNEQRASGDDANDDKEEDDDDESYATLDDEPDHSEPSTRYNPRPRGHFDYTSTNLCARIALKNMTKSVDEPKLAIAMASKKYNQCIEGIVEETTTQNKNKTWVLVD